MDNVVIDAPDADTALLFAQEMFKGVTSVRLVNVENVPTPPGKGKIGTRWNTNG